MTGSERSSTTLGHVPDCDRYTSCGGCGLMALDYGAQRAEKARQFAKHWEAAGLPSAPVRWVLGNAAPLRYRNRIRCQVAADGRVHFFNQQKLETCAVLDDSVHAGVDLAKQTALRHPNAMRHFASLEVRGFDSCGRGAIAFRRRSAAAACAPSASEFDRARAELRAEWPEAWLVAGLDDEPAPCQRWQLASDVYAEVPVDAFMQVNTEVNRLLVEHVRSGLLLRQATDFVDLFMGSGNFALPLLAKGLAGYAVEAHVGAVRAAVRAAQAQGLSFAEARSGDADRCTREWLERGLEVDIVICDPPRPGLKGGVPTVARLARRAVVLCSCNPRSLVRDVADFLAQGFAVAEVSLFDMFPQTSHLESVVWLHRVRRA